MAASARGCEGPQGWSAAVRRDGTQMAEPLFKLFAQNQYRRRRRRRRRICQTGSGFTNAAILAL